MCRLNSYVVVRCSGKEVRFVSRDQGFIAKDSVDRSIKRLMVDFDLSDEPRDAQCSLYPAYEGRNLPQFKRCLAPRMFGCHFLHSETLSAMELGFPLIDVINFQATDSEAILQKGTLHSLFRFRSIDVLQPRSGRRPSCNLVSSIRLLQGRVPKN